MTTRSWLRLQFVALLAVTPLVAGCDVDNHPTATGKSVQAPETQGVEDPGKLNSGGPGAQGKTPK